MKHLRKSILTLLALTLFGGAGAWAQGPTAAELTIPASWNQDNTPLTAADLPGFVAVDSATADQWVDASTTGYAKLIYAFTTDGQAKYIRFQPGLKLWGTNTYYREAAYEDYDHDFQVFYTTGGGAIELTKEGANQWTLGQTPDYDLELQVEYYEAHALKDIPAGWTVMVNGIEQTKPYQGDSLMITETDSVTLVPAGNPRRVKSVTLEDEAPAVVEPITVTWNNNDITGSGYSFTKDGVTITSDIDFNQKNFMGGGTFTTTLGNFTKIEVTAGSVSMLSGTGWSGNSTKKTWTGNASSVSFSGDIMGMGMGNIQFVFTIEPTN